MSVGQTENVSLLKKCEMDLRQTGEVDGSGRPEVGQQQQHQEQQQILDFHHKIHDKRLQELRVFALEYVKQIVAKASEISQERLGAKNAQKLASFYTGANYQANQREQQQQCNQQTAYKRPNYSHYRLIQPADAESERRMREAAAKINDRFQIRDVGDQDDNAAPFRPLGRPEQLNLGRQQGPEEQRAGADGTGSSCKQAAGSGGRRKRFRERLNWHLLVACFSTCLPNNIADTVPSFSSSANFCEGGRGV